MVEEADDEVDIRIGAVGGEGGLNPNTLCATGITDVGSDLVGDVVGVE